MTTIHEVQYSIEYSSVYLEEQRSRTENIRTVGVPPKTTKSQFRIHAMSITISTQVGIHTYFIRSFRKIVKSEYISFVRSVRLSVRKELVSNWTVFHEI